MYFITAIVSSDTVNGKVPFKRTFGYGLDKETALHYVRTNLGNMHECLYDYLVIERIKPGIHSVCDHDIWFHWTGKRWKHQGKKPLFAKGLINWAIG
jgi:hypothetical protein